MKGRDKGGRSLWRLRSDRGASGLAVAALSLLAGFISLPMIALILWTANENAWHAMAASEAREAMLLSIKTTSISMLVIVLLGTPAAYVLARSLGLPA